MVYHAHSVPQPGMGYLIQVKVLVHLSSFSGSFIMVFKSSTTDFCWTSGHLELLLIGSVIVPQLILNSAKNYLK